MVVRTHSLVPVKDVCGWEAGRQSLRQLQGQLKERGGVGVGVGVGVSGCGRICRQDTGICGMALHSTALLPVKRGCAMDAMDGTREQGFGGCGETMPAERALRVMRGEAGNVDDKFVGNNEVLRSCIHSCVP